MHFLAIYTGKGGHDSLNAGLYRRFVSCAVYCEQFRFIANRIAFVISKLRAAIANEMFGCCHDIILF